MAKKTIKPIQKKIEVQTPDNLTTGASLDDYEKVAQKMAMSSDQIIDAALDRMEGRHRGRPRADQQPGVPLPSQAQLPEQKPEPPAERPEAPSTPETPPVQAPQASAPADEGFSQKIMALNERTRSLQSMLDQALAANADLTRRLKMFEDETKALVDKNDDMLLRNSELEFEISRLGAENTALKAEFEKIRNAKRLPPQTYSKEAYTRPPSQPQALARKQPIQPTHPIVARGPRMSMNGYESWN